LGSFSFELYGDEHDLDDITVDIPSAYLTMEQGQRLLHDLQHTSQSSNTDVFIVLYERDRPTTNLSLLMIWALGVFVATLAAYLSADEYRDFYCTSTSVNNNDNNLDKTVIKATIDPQHQIMLHRQGHIDYPKNRVNLVR
jgi:beta-lactamase regulating signal transducer with metallopeptidase domain